MQNKNTRERTSEKLKQKLLANENRLKQYKEKLKQYHQNRDFVNSPDRFHNELQEICFSSFLLLFPFLYTYF